MRLLVCLAVAAAPTLAHAAAPVRIYLNRDGATLTGGADDPARGRSWIASNTDGGEVTIPAFSGGDRRWQAIVSCVRGHFAPFAVDVVDARPASGDYSMIMVGGQPGLLGMGRGVSGVAPADGVVLRRAVGFAFSASLDDAVQATCDTIAHEAGHTLGLDHAMACDDLMSYGDCGKRSFRDRTSACGEFEARACDGGDETQNSYRRLARMVGLRDASPVVSEPPREELESEDEPVFEDETGARPAADPEADSEPDPEADSDPDAEADPDPDSDPDADPDPDADAAPDDDGEDVARCGAHEPADDAARAESTIAAPTIELARARLRGDRWIAIRVAHPQVDDLADLELEWTTPDGTHTWSCAETPADEPVACRPDARGATFALLVGTGARTVRAIAIDARGGRHAGPSVQVELR